MPESTEAKAEVVPCRGRKTRNVETIAVCMLLTVFTRVAVVSLVAFRFPRGWFFTKGLELGQLAHSLAAGQGFSSPFGGNTGPSAYLAPGYPALISLIFHFCGDYTLASALVVMGMQVMFSLCTLLIIMHIARMCFGDQAATLSGVFWALSPPLMWVPTIFWDTALSTLMIAGLFALALKTRRKPNALSWTLLVVGCAGAALVNPALLPTLLALSVWAVWPGKGRVCSLREALLAVVLFLLIITPWPLRNLKLLHAFIPLRSNFGFELWNGNQSGSDGTFQQSLHPGFNPQEMRAYASLGEVAYMREKSAMAHSYIRSHPLQFVWLSTKRAWLFWTGQAQGTSRTSLVLVFHALLTTLLALPGFLLVLRHKRNLFVPLVLPLIIFPLPYYITHPDFRFRILLDPFTIVVSAYALTQFRQKRLLTSVVESRELVPNAIC